MKKLYIAVDFDGTVVGWDYPRIGLPIGSVPVLKKLCSAGHKLILCTMRDGDLLGEAEKWFYSNGIPLYGVNSNKSQYDWTSSKKIYAHLYIDDQALGAPLKMDPSISEKPFIDWAKVEEILRQNNIIE